MASTKINIIANFGGRAWSFLSAFLFLPLYLKILGGEAYGIVGFSAVVIGIISFMDAGLTATLMREFARVDRSNQNKQNILKTVETIYLGICFIIFIAIWTAAPWIAKYWLNNVSLDINMVIHSLRIMGVCIALQLLSNLYIGGIMGLGKQVMANALNIGFGLLRYGGVLVFLIFIPSLEIYFYWQFFALLIFVITTRAFLKKPLQVSEKPIFSKDLFKDIYQYAFGMMSVSIFSAIFIQSDKLIVSKMLSLSNFGYYALASQISQIPLVLATPFALAIYPRMTGYVSARNKENLNHLFKQTSLAITLLITLATALLFWFMPTILYLWTQNIEMATYTTPAARILCLGSWFQGLQVVPYYLGLANGHTRTNLIMGICSVFLLTPLLIPLVQKMGVIGATIPWLVMSVVIFFILSYLIIKKFSTVSFTSWLLESIAAPVIWIWSIVSLIKGIEQCFYSSIYISSICLGIAGFAGLGIVYLLYRRKYPSIALFQTK